MNTQVSQPDNRTLEIIDASSPESSDLIKSQIEAGRNFILLMRDDPLESQNFYALFHLEQDGVPKRLSEEKIRDLQPYFSKADSDKLAEAANSGKIVLFIDQLDLPLNRPPDIEPFLVYSPLWGIISRHPILAKAREAIQSDNFESVEIQQWTGSEWSAV